MDSNSSSFPKSRRLLAHDFSGSTSNCSKYFEIIKREIYNDFNKDSFTDILLWSGKAEKVSKTKYENILNSKIGSGWTAPIAIVQWLAENHFDGDAILITDGQITYDEVNRLDRYLDKHLGEFHLSHIKCYLIQTSSQKIDTTVISPFLRRFSNEVFVFGDQDELPIQIQAGTQTQDELIETLRSIKTIEEFENESNGIFSNVVTQMMGKPINIEIRDEILKLQKRLMLELRTPPKNFNMDELLKAFADHDIQKMFLCSKQLNDLYTQQHQNMIWPKLIFHLIRMSSGSLNNVYSIHALGTAFQANRIRRADVAEAFDAVHAEMTETTTDFLCPITYESESDVVLLIQKPDQPLLSTIEHDKLNEIITCPLAVLKYKEILDNLIKHIDHPISLQALKSADNANATIEFSPLTRLPIIGGLCLGAAEDHCKATDWTIAKLMCNGKKVGNMDQWFALIWYIIEKGMIPYLNPILPKIREHLIFRLHNHFGTATLTGIPFICQTALPAGICCWFALSIDPDRFLKAHAADVPVIIKMTELLGYPITPSTKQHALIFATEERCRFMGNSIIPYLIKASYVTSKKYPDVIIDGEISEQERKDALNNLPIAFSDIPIDILRIVVNHLLGGSAKTVPFVNWGYGLEPCNMPPIPICPTTYRPFLLTPPDFVPWPIAAEKFFCPRKDLINCHSQYIKYVNKNHSFPSKSEFATFCMQQIVPFNKPTLPAQIDQFIDCVVDGYNQLFSEIGQITPDDFIHITNNTFYFQSRIRTEKEYYNTCQNKPPDSAYDFFLNSNNK